MTDRGIGTAMLGTLENEPEMSPEEFKMIRDFILEKSGIYFADNKAYLVKNRLAKRMADLQITSIRDYLYHVKYDLSLHEFNRLMDLVTTNETSFFRNEPQLLSFAEEVLPLLIEEKSRLGSQKTLRLWSAGCSTGEEPYTLAIILLDKLRSLAGWSIEIVANDISEQVLQKARRGEYSGMTLRNVKPEHLARYFETSGDEHRIKPEVQGLVKFSHMNLNDPRKVSMINNVDIIFCRNVMIYFAEEAKRQLVRGFYNSLRPGGYLYIGHAETLHGISKAFKLVYFKNALVYQKETVAAAPRTEPAAHIAATQAAVTGASRALDLLGKMKPLTVGK